MTAEGPERVNAASLRTVFIINPIAGRPSTRAARRQRVEDFVRQHRIDARIELSRRPGHARELAHAAVAAGAELVVSIGGDGTLNEVAGALVGTRALYGIIPTGSGNGLGRDLGLPLDFNRALQLLVHGAVREIDSGVVNGLPFFNVMGIGFDAEVGRRFNLSPRRGLWSYVRIGLGAFFTYHRQPIAIESSSGERVSVQAILTTIANSSQYGNNARIAPRARLDDGQLDLVAITTRNVALALPLVWRLFRGTIDRSRFVRTITGTRFVIERAHGGPIHTDGEIHDCDGMMEIAVRPASLRVVVPRVPVNGR